MKLADHVDGDRSLIEKFKGGIHCEPVIDNLLDILLLLGLVFRLGLGLELQDFLEGSLGALDT